MTSFDAVVVGAGPNGLAAAVELARSGLSVLVREGAPGPGGAARTQELTLPGFQHDVCSSVHPLGAASPFFHSIPLARLGVSWVLPVTQLAHPLADGRVAVLERSLEATAHSLGADGAAWLRLMQPLVDNAERLLEDVLAPFRWPAHPALMARFGVKAIRSAAGLAHSVFRGDAARALFGGMAAHSGSPLEAISTAAFGLVLGVAGHAVGWPFARGGSRTIIDALVAHLEALGGTIQCGLPVQSLAELPRARAVLLDVTPRQLLVIAGRTLPARYRRALERYVYGPGVFKLDWALAGPIPWTSPDCCRAGTVHLGGGFPDLAASERAAWRNERCERPFTIVAQPSVVDAGRAPPGKHVAWGYCHVPNGADWDMTATIESMIERHAPGFLDLILARHAAGPAQLEQHDPNLVGGDIAGGAMGLRQLFLRPTMQLAPYRTPLQSVYLCSASTPPGGGVHGMCGYFAARTALRDLGA